MKIVLATGGTGGHLFPALKVAKHLNSQGHETLFVGSLKIKTDLFERERINFIDIEAKGLTSSNPLEVIKTVFLMIRGVWRSIGILRSCKPDVVCGFGGYGAFAVVFSAALLRIPSMIHEQNITPGKANRLLARFVKKVAISFKPAEKFFPDKKTILTGCPSHLPSYETKSSDIRLKLGLKPESFTIFVLGGSQGSSSINNAFLEAVSGLCQDFEVQIIHMTGRKTFDSVQKEYRKKNINAAVFDFIYNISDVYEAADLIVSRAGAVTLTEIIQFKKPAILIPYPYAQGHQVDNAKFLSDSGAAVLIEEKDLTAERLKNDMALLVKDGNKREKMVQKLDSKCPADAVENLSQAIVNC